jgi:hypothetical protein
MDHRGFIRRLVFAEVAGVRHVQRRHRRGQTCKYINIFARIQRCDKWLGVRGNLSKNKDEQFNSAAPAPDASAGRPELGQKKLKELKKAGHPVDRLHASFDKCKADARAHAAGRDTRYDARV